MQAALGDSTAISLEELAINRTRQKLTDREIALRTMIGNDLERLDAANKIGAVLAMDRIMILNELLSIWK
ncbi:MAG: hypothetical protein AAF958_08335 [Planctomycetota bacterium]